VDKLLASFLKDVGITAEQFMNACKEGSGSPQFSRMHRVGSFIQNSWKNPAGITSKELKPGHECMRRGKWESAV